MFIVKFKKFSSSVSAVKADLNNYIHPKDNLRMFCSHIYTTFLKIKEDKD